MLADIRADARRAATLAAEVMLGNYRRQVREALTVADPRRRVLLERIMSMLLDPASLAYLDGSQIDFDDGLHGKGFEIKNPNAQSTCGCGKSFN